MYPVILPQSSENVSELSVDFTFLRTDSYKLRGEEPQSTSCLLPSLQGEETEAQNGRSLGCTHTAPEENSAQSERLPVFMEQCCLFFDEV